MEHNKIFTIAVGLALILSLSSFTFGYLRKEKPVKSFVRKLNLTTQQQDKLRSYFNELEIEELKLSAIRKELYFKVQSELVNDSINSRELKDLAEVKMTEMDNISQRMIDVLIEINRLLTAEQRQKLAELLANRHSSYYYSNHHRHGANYH